MRLAYRSWGSPTEPPALLIHGATDASSTWRKVGLWLARRGWHTIAVDLRGHGASPSDRDAADRSLAPLANDVVETLRALRPDADGVELLVGHSLGTLVGLTCATEHPGFVKRLVLEDPPGESIDHASLAGDVRERIALARSDQAALVRRTLSEEPRAAEDDVRVKVAAIAAADPVYVAELIETLAGLDVADLAARCRVPALVLLGRDKGTPLGEGSEDHAEFSTLSGEDRVRFRAALGPDAVVAELDAGHDIHQTALPDFLARLGEWLGEAPRRGRARS